VLEHLKEIGVAFMCVCVLKADGGCCEKQEEESYYVAS
jgi:hypothetical protein